MNDRQRALLVYNGEAGVVDGADIEIAAVAAAGQIELRQADVDALRDQIGVAVLQRHNSVVLQEAPVGQEFP